MAFPGRLVLACFIFSELVIWGGINGDGNGMSFVLPVLDLGSF